MNIKQLAKKLDLSITTVSRALSGYSDVSEKTRERVKKFAVKYNYIKHTVENDDGTKEHNAGVGDVHNGQERLSKDDRKEKPTRSVQKSPKRKQKTVRSSGKSKDKTGTGRKPRRTKNKSS